MKKLFTLSLALLMAAAGYSQMRTASSKDVRVAPMKKVARMENLTNVQSQPNMTRIDFESGELDYTTYDWQSNDGARTWTINWPDGKVSFGYTIASDDNFSDRGTGIGTYDANENVWIPSEGRVEKERTGFGTIARYRQNSIIVAAHTATECGVYIVEDKDNITPECAVTLPKLNNDYDPSWPNVMTSGANRDIIHIVANAYEHTDVPGAEGCTDPLIYFRSMDGGQTWDKQNVILPYLTPEYGTDWTSNCAYWMETTEDNCLALVVNNAWSDGMVIYSYDDGETWSRKVFYHHPGPNDDMTDHMVAYPRWTSAQWGIGGELCLAYEFNGTTGTPGSGRYYPGLGGVAFWGENMPYRSQEYAQWGYDPTNANPPVYGQPFVMDSAYIYQDIYASWPLFSDGTHVDEGMLPEYFGYLCALDANSDWESWDDATEWNIDDRTLHGEYNSGCVAMPVLCTLPGCGGFDMVSVWSCMDENHTDDGGNYFYKLFAAYSGDGGRTWTHPVHITNNFLFTYNECVYTQAAVIGEKLVVAAMMDGKTGTFVQSDDEDSSDNLYQGIVFDLKEIFPDAGVGVQEVESTVDMNVYPNPAVDQLNVMLSKSSTITVYNIMGQLVKTQEGHIGGNVIDLSNMNSGVYFITAGNNTQKFVVK